MPEGTDLLLEHVSLSFREVAQPKKPLAAVLMLSLHAKGTALQQQ